VALGTPARSATGVVAHGLGGAPAGGAV